MRSSSQLTSNTSKENVDNDGEWRMRMENSDNKKKRKEGSWSAWENCWIKRILPQPSFQHEWESQMTATNVHIEIAAAAAPLSKKNQQHKNVSEHSAEWEWEWRCVKNSKCQV